ncbi:hypothetical protein [Kitasatospora sp. NPDC001527]|uniref:hypothetical protein n=1 Tax=Kitasatospora sp. NPDC001527 TaxID=3154519 RepID=UPI00332CBBD7
MTLLTPQARYAEPTAPDLLAEVESGVWTVEFEDYTSRCQCPWRKYLGCVDDLPLPPRLGLYVHRDGRRGSFVGRWRRHDPTTLVVIQTAVVFEHVNADNSVSKWALKCALLGPAAYPKDPIGPS